MLASWSVGGEAMRTAYVIGLSLSRPRVRLVEATCRGILRAGLLSSRRLNSTPSIKIQSKKTPDYPPAQTRYLRLEPTKDTTAAQDSQLKAAHPVSMSTAGAPPYNKLKYYTAGTPNGLKPAIVLEELGVPYEVQAINIMKNEQKEDWYLEINPNGRIPSLKDGDLRVFESGAIMLYLTDMYDKEKKFSYAYGSREYYEMMSWLMFQMGGIGPMQGI